VPDMRRRRYRVSEMLSVGRPGADARPRLCRCDRAPSSATATGRATWTVVIAAAKKSAKPNGVAEARLQPLARPLNRSTRRGASPAWRWDFITAPAAGFVEQQCGPDRKCGLGSDSSASRGGPAKLGPMRAENRGVRNGELDSDARVFGRRGLEQQALVTPLVQQPARPRGACRDVERRSPNGRSR